MRAKERVRSTKEQSCHRPFSPNWRSSHYPMSRSAQKQPTSYFKTAPPQSRSFAAPWKSLRPIIGKRAVSSKEAEAKTLDCVYCAGNHYSDQCTRYVTVQARKQKLAFRCFKCLSASHRSSNCNSVRSCVYCRTKDHHRSICPSRNSSGSTIRVLHSTNTQSFPHSLPVADASAASSPPDGPVVTMPAMGSRILMKTEIGRFQHPSLSSGTVLTRILFDCGSQYSYITGRLSDYLGLSRLETEDVFIYFCCFSSQPFPHGSRRSQNRFCRR